MRSLRAALVLVLLVCVLPVGGLDLEKAGRGADAALAGQIDAVIDAETGLRGGVQGVAIQSLRSGATWYERNADALLLPASNQKLLTSAAVLDALGPDWRYVTRLLASGSVDARGELRGNLYLVGSGDPLLSSADLDALAQAARKAGIRHVAGRVIGDDSRFDRQRYGDGWASDDMPFYYSAQISALNVDENVVLVRADPGSRVGERLAVEVTPASGYLRVVNRAHTSAKGARSALFIGRELGKNRVTIDGTLALDAPAADHRPEPITVESPARYAAALFTRGLRRVGITVDGEGREGAAPRSGTHEVARHQGLPLGDVLKRLNKPSDNLVAECLLKTLSAEKGKSGVGSAAEGRQLATAWLVSVGLDAAGLDMTDGSGLSRQNFVTARNLARLLAVMHSHRYSQVYADSLPIAGVDGTMRNRLKGTPAEGNCRAKSGYVSSVSSLSGYVTTKDGEPLVFSIVMNNHKAGNATAMAVQNQIVTLLASYGKPAGH